MLTLLYAFGILLAVGSSAILIAAHFWDDEDYDLPPRKDNVIDLTGRRMGGWLTPCPECGGDVRVFIRPYDPACRFCRGEGKVKPCDCGRFNCKECGGRP